VSSSGHLVCFGGQVVARMGHRVCSMGHCVVVVGRVVHVDVFGVLGVVGIDSPDVDGMKCPMDSLPSQPDREGRRAVPGRRDVANGLRVE
jgi:hypothetical protein